MATFNITAFIGKLGWIRDSGLAQEQKSAAIRYAIAKALAYDAPIPTSAPDSPKSFYITNIEAVIDSILSEVNEQFVLDYQATKALTYEIWRARVELVYDPVAACDNILSAALDPTRLDGSAREVMAGWCFGDTVSELTKLLRERS